MIPELPEDVRTLYPFAPRWVEVAGYSLHYVDEGPRGTDAVVLLHGNPTWSFLYRAIIPAVAAAGFRVVAPDYLGCGRSDHAGTEAAYAIAHHTSRTLAVLDGAGVERAVLFCQDWGGPIGLGMAVTRPRLLAGVVLANTFYGIGSAFHHRPYPWRGLHLPVAGPLLFGRTHDFLLGLKVSGPPSIHSGAAWKAYRLPFDVHGGAGATLAWPRAIAITDDHPTRPLAEAIWQNIPRWDVPVRVVWGTADAVFPYEEAAPFIERFPRGREHAPALVGGARHFVQEYAPAECAAAVIDVAREAFG